MQALQHELAEKQPVLQSFTASVNQLQPYLGPGELTNIDVDQTNVFTSWETITNTAKQHSERLQEAVEQRTAFWEGWTKFVEWLTVAEERLAKTDEIYSDEVNEACGELQVRWQHTCQVLRFRRSHYGFPEKLKTTAVVRNDYGFTLGWGCTFLVTI